MGRVVATVGDALGPTARAGRFAGFTTCGADWPAVDSHGPATRAAGETPQGRVAGGRVYHGEVEAAADWGVDPAGVWRAPGGKFRVADPAADGLERAAPDEPGPATESRGSDAMEADAVAFPKQGAARQELLIAFSDESGLSERSVHARPCHGRVLPETSVRVRLKLSPKWCDSSGALKRRMCDQSPGTTPGARIPRRCLIVVP